MILDIEYKSYRKKDDIYGTVLYPAVMVAPVQKAVLSKVIKKEEVKSIFDPFVGSGTSLYEASELCEGVKLIGCDINPLAFLITKTKLDGITLKTFDKEINRIEHIIKNDQSKSIHKFNNSEKWFREDIAIDLTKIRRAIKSVDTTENRNYFWCIMSDIVRKYSNTRSSTYKLHIKKTEDIERMENNVIRDFIYYARESSHQYLNRNNNYYLYKKDSLELMKSFTDNSIDIVITSPPYGDNATTVPYGQFSMLSLYWIERSDLELEGWELENYSIIDRKSIGGMTTRSLSEYEYSLIGEYIRNISNNKQRKVLNYFADYFDFLTQISRITNKYLILTLGNRNVDNITINLSGITQRFLNDRNFIIEIDEVRNIPYKRIPKITSRVNSKPVSSMNKENIMVFRNMSPVY